MALLRVLSRLAAALLLLALAVWLVGPERLRGPLGHVDPVWFGAALVTAALAQWCSVLRWETIARIFGLRTRTAPMAIAYAQGMTVNVLLPGATLGGDALRSVRLQALGNPLGVSALTVLLDRLSGLWVLCTLSLATVLLLLLFPGLLGAAAAPAALALPGGAGVLAAAGSQGVLLLYAAGLALACALPWLPLRGRGPAAAGRAWWQRLWARLCELHALALAQRVPLLRSLWSSLLVQVLCAATLWLCLLAAGGHAAYWRVQAVAAPVFVAGALPISYGGFGARELVALAAFPLVGLAADQGLAASALYGLVAVVLGMATAPAFVLGAGGGKPAGGG